MGQDRFHASQRRETFLPGGLVLQHKVSAKRPDLPDAETDQHHDQNSHEEDLHLGLIDDPTCGGWVESKAENSKPWLITDRFRAGASGRDMEGHGQLVDLFSGPECYHTASKLPCLSDIRYSRVFQTRSIQSRIRVCQNPPV